MKFKSGMNSPQVIIITGPRGKGKSTLVQELISDHSFNRFSCEGIVAKGFLNPDGTKDFILHNINGKEEITLASKNPVESFIEIGNYFFNPVALKSGKKILYHAIKKNTQVIIIDEIGPLELDDKVWAPALKLILKSFQGALILTIRENLIDEVINKFQISMPIILNIQINTKFEIIRDILGILNFKYNYSDGEKTLLK